MSGDDSPPILFLGELPPVGLVEGGTKLSADALKTIGIKGKNSGIRIVEGTADDAAEFFIEQVDVTTIYEPEPGIFVATDTNGFTFTYRPASKSGPPTIDVNGIKGLRKIKFIRAEE